MLSAVYGLAASVAHPGHTLPQRMIPTPVRALGLIVTTQGHIMTCQGAPEEHDQTLEDGGQAQVAALCPGRGDEGVLLEIIKVDAHTSSGRVQCHT